MIFILYVYLQNDDSNKDSLVCEITKSYDKLLSSLNLRMSPQY